MTRFRILYKGLIGSASVPLCLLDCWQIINLEISDAYVVHIHT